MPSPTLRTTLTRLAALAASLAMSLGSTAQAAPATASAQLSNITIQMFDINPNNSIYPWLWVPTNVDWLPPSSSASAQLDTPPLSQTQTGWIGAGQTADVAAPGGQASAWVGTGDLNAGASGFAGVSAQDGATATAIAQIFSGRFLAGPDTGLIVTATVTDLQANAAGGLAQAVASLGIYDADTGANFDSSQAWAFDAPDFSSSSSPQTLSVMWQNGSTNAVWGQLDAVASAQALSAAATVPEPTTVALVATCMGLLVVCRRRGTSRTSDQVEKEL